MHFAPIERTLLSLSLAGSEGLQLGAYARAGAVEDPLREGLRRAPRTSSSAPVGRGRSEWGEQWSYRSPCMKEMDKNHFKKENTWLNLGNICHFC